ncbi:MAG TPA: cytochrome c oxidase subunit 4 [Mycobacteriales bacterium]|nr:cytochrome c oxidase subunit 4 [Mycobacteriales bacterium]
MRIEGLIFALLSVFLLVIGSVYWIVSRDPTGFTCILLAGGLALIIGYYLLFTAQRMDLRPEDREDAEIAEGAGEVGFFAPHSWWPMFLAGSSAITAMGLIFGPFLALIGVFALLIALSGLLFEYYVGINRTQAHTLGDVRAMGESPTGTDKFFGEKH